MLDRIVEFFSKLIGLVELPPPKLTMKHVDEIRYFCEPGDVLLCRAHWSLASLFIPGYWDHAAVIISKKQVLEATTHGVVVTRLEDLVLRKDAISLWTPNKTFSITQVPKLVNKFEGTPYDYKFNPRNRALYCSELVVKFFRFCGPLIDFKKSKSLFNKDYYCPGEFLNTGDWDCLYDTNIGIKGKLKWHL